MSFKIAHLLLVTSLLGIAFPADAIVPLPIIEEYEGADGANILRINISERYVKDITDQDTYRKHLSATIHSSYWDSNDEAIGLMLTQSIITFSGVGLLYEIPPTALDKFRGKFTLHRASSNTETCALAKIADITLSNMVERLTHQGEKLRLFDQTREVLTGEMHSTNPFIKWMTYRVLARTAYDEGKVGQAANLVLGVLGSLPSKYKNNVEATLRLLQAQSNNSLP